MEPKDLKNSKQEELENQNIQPDSTTEPVEPETAQEAVFVEEVPVADEAVVVEKKSVGEEEASVKETAPITDNEPVSEEKTVEPETVQESVAVEEEEGEEVTEGPEIEKEEGRDEGDEVDYTEFSQVELINELRSLLDGDKSPHLKEKAETIKKEFYKKHWAKVNELKKEFIAEGGEEQDFKPEANPYEQDLKDLLKKYRDKKAENNKRTEEQKDKNLEEKYKVIEGLKNLVNAQESINKTFHDFRELQKKWHEIGQVPQAKLKDLWETYHHHVENFYDYVKINKELRDLDLKKNMEEKIKLCEKAEELLVEPSILKAFQTLQKFHERWREIGPVPREKKDELWERFKDATSKINKKHQEFFEQRKKEQKENFETKTALCEKVEEILTLELTTHKEWDEKSKELIALQKVWRTVGFAPKKYNNPIYERFRNSCDQFFDKKREFYSKSKEIQQHNLQLKIDLCLRAEELKESTDWKKTTEEMISIQKQWKEVGSVPRKQSDPIWKRFRTACDFFFEKKKGHFKEMDSTQDENLALKEQLIEEVKKFEVTGNNEVDIDQLKDFQRRWTEIGHVPYKQKDALFARYREAINLKFDSLKVDDRNKNLLKFRDKVDGFKDSAKGLHKMDLERDKYVSKLKQLENELTLLDNNIGFFANTKNAETLIGDVQKKMDKIKEQIEFLKEKIRIIDEIDEAE